MREYPILFSDPMVKAILEGRKAQTRRVVIRKNRLFRYLRRDLIDGGRTFVDGSGTGPVEQFCPYGAPGDRLWVREAAMLRAVGSNAKGELEWFDLSYRSANPMETGFTESFRRDSCKPYRATRWTPSIHMPRWASRIILEVKDVRVERLRAITEEDAEAEGFMSYWLKRCQDEDCGTPNAIGWYAGLWDSLNKDRGYGWARNPWVWVVSFRRLKA